MKWHFASGAPAPARRPVARAAVLLLAVLGLAGCGGEDKDKPATQVAAKVNKEELSVHQINYVLSQQRGLRAEQADAAGRLVLERLIDQELALQKAGELRVDRDPRVLQALEAARREIIARAYTEKVTAYYNAKPALFKERRIYSLQELAIEAKPEQIDGLRKALADAKSFPAFIEHLKSNDFRFGANQAVRAAEQLPLTSVDTFAKMKDGDTMFNPTPNGVQVIFLVGSRSQPVSEERARPAIEQFLLNDRKRKIIEDDIKSLRKTAKIEYVGKFAESAASAAERAKKEAPPEEAPKPAYVPQPEPQLPAASALDAGAVNSGIGLKGDRAAPASVVAPPSAPPASGALDVNAINSGMGLNK
jgi:EpsD family peptidyl-prolyl cis-trans isomerase